jgi:hypothetical protein
MAFAYSASSSLIPAMLLQPLPRSFFIVLILMRKGEARSVNTDCTFNRFRYMSSMKCIWHFYRCSNVSGVQSIRNFIPLGGYLAAKSSAVTYLVQLLWHTVRLYLYEVYVQECEMISLERIPFLTVRSEFFNNLAILQSYQVPFQFPFRTPSPFLHSHNSD